ncbi:hypothetical protein [Microcystis sp. M_QC_C_20170808_M9Col]|uniref:hypothetical protein n=1 Tax=Microcystis sp. M_QC_C_20170808_M9Col TaxID=2486217 RepID=UPI002579467F|nr:hypothetical protein [Microcystis sp. M_QC_C_20170808_M9Col]
MTNQPIIQVLASATFKRNLRTLAKKYRSIRDDIQPMIEQLEQGESFKALILKISRISPNPFTVASCLLPLASSQQAI